MQPTNAQALGLSMGVAQADVIVLDALRRQRNLSDYEGDPVSAATLASCLEQAAKLLSHTEDWLARQNPAWRGKAP